MEVLDFIFLILGLGGLGGGYYKASSNQLALQGKNDEVNKLIKESKAYEERAKEAELRADEAESKLLSMKRKAENTAMDMDDAVEVAKKEARKLEKRIAELESEVFDWKCACGTKDAEIQRLKEKLNA